MNGYEDWLPDNWLPVSAPLSSQRISELLAQVDHEDMVNYFRLRFDRSKQNYQKWLEEIKQKAQKQSSAMPPSTLQKMYMALDSTAISTFSMTIEDAAYGHAKQNPELKQINLTLAVDFLNGDVCYAREDEGSITDKSVYKSILAQMKSYGFDLDETVLVTDRGYSSLMNLQNLFNTDVSFVAGVPIVEKGLKDKFTKFREALCDLAFYNSEYDVYCRTIKEDWKQNTEAGSVNRDCFVHLYRFPEIALSQQKQLLKKIDKVLDKKRDGKLVDRDDWNFAARFITEREEEAKALKTDLENRFEKMGGWLAQINSMAPEVKENRFQAVRERVQEILQRMEAVLDESRFLQEIALMADKLDVSEECTRLEAHMKRLSELLDNAEDAGRKLDFTLQECFREINTCGNKVQDFSVSAIVVDYKNELEKCREQVQNLE